MSQVIAVRRNERYEVVVNLLAFECPVQGCGVVYGIPEEFRDRRHAKGEGYYCPNGHYLSWAESDLDRERTKRERAEQRADQAEQAARHQREQAAAARRSASAYKAHLTRIKNRIAKGVCPVQGCKRSGFTKVMSHIASQHPDWHADHAGDLA